MESQLVDGLKKRWFVEGLQPALKKKMKIVPPASYVDAYNRAMDLESEQKMGKKKKTTHRTQKIHPLKAAVARSRGRRFEY